MITISLCMIVKNEEKVIERCLNTVSDIVDEIIIVDTGSQDGTKEKVKKYRAKVFDYKWQDDFAKARNYSFSQASKEYILWLDADDVLEKEAQEKLKELKGNLNEEIDVISMKYVLSTDQNNKPAVFLRRNRLVKREKNYLWIGRVHEYLSVYGSILNADIAVRHLKDKEYSDRNLKIYRKMLVDKEEFSPRDTFYYANELYDNQYYIDAMVEYSKFINLKEVWLEDVKQASLKLAECYKIIENKEQELECLLNSLKYDIPSGELCCKIANNFYEKEKYEVAIFWYEASINNKPKENEISLVNNCFSTWVPALQLCVCYCKVGNFKKANEFNEIAAEYVPSHSSVLNNRVYLKDKI